MRTTKKKTPPGGLCRCGKRLPRVAHGEPPYEFCSDECAAKHAPKPIKDAPCNLTDFVDPEDGFRRIAIVIDAETSVDLVLADGTRIATLNAFALGPKDKATANHEDANLVAIVDLIVQEGAQLKGEGQGLLWFNRIGAEESNRGASRHFSSEATVPTGACTSIVSVQLERRKKCSATSP